MATLVLADETQAVLRRAGDCLHLMTPEERSRMDAFRHTADRQDFLAAHVIARLCASRLLGTDPAGLSLLQRCSRCAGAHGRPSFAEAPEAGVSLSHTRGYVAAAVTHGLVGVDVERPSTEAPDWGLVAMTMSPAELAALRQLPEPGPGFVRQWVRKEALVKVGGATLDTLADVDLPVGEDARMRWEQWHLLSWEVPGPTGPLGAAAALEPPTLESLSGAQGLRGAAESQAARQPAGPGRVIVSGSRSNQSSTARS